MMDRRRLEAYCGDLSQIFYIQECILEGGKAKNTKGYMLDNGEGLELLILADKCFTIPRLKYDGVNIGFISKTGICAPEFYQEEGTRGFLRNFEGGFLTTCGLSYFGTPCIRDGQKNGLHGVISNTPLENVRAYTEWREENPHLILKGDGREGFLFGPNLSIHKEIVIPVGKNRIEIHDMVVNHAFERTPLMILYHFNFGYPFLDASTQVYTDYGEPHPRDEDSRNRLKDINLFGNPTPDSAEIVAWRVMEKEKRKEARTLVFNPKLEMAVLMTLDPIQLPVLNQWKSMKSGDYVLGVEPGTGHVGGLERTEKDGLLQYLEPGQAHTVDIQVDFMKDVQQIRELIKTF